MADPAPQLPDQATSAEDRTVLAAERTFAAWLRTGLAFLSVGLALQRVLRGEWPQWELRLSGSALIACALASFAAAGWRDRHLRSRLPQPDVRLLPAALTGALALLLAAISILSGVTLWLL